MARDLGSLVWAFVTGIFAFAFNGLLWALFDDELADHLMQMSLWQTGSDPAMIAREWVQLAWQWEPLMVLLGMGIEALIAARLTGDSSSNIIVRTFGLFIVHVFMIFWAAIFPELLDPLFGVAMDMPEVTGSPMGQHIPWYHDLLFAYVPALVLVGANLFYLIAPIRDDVTGSVRYA